MTMRSEAMSMGGSLMTVRGSEMTMRGAVTTMRCAGITIKEAVMTVRGAVMITKYLNINNGYVTTDSQHGCSYDSSSLVRLWRQCTPVISVQL